MKHGNFDKRFSCSFTGTDHQHLIAAAGEVGMPISTYVRRAAVAYTQNRFLVPPRIHELLEKHLTNARRIGNNVNQVARQVNVVQRVTNSELKEVRAILEELEDTIQLFRVVIENVTPQEPRDYQVDTKKNNELWSDAQLPQQTNGKGELHTPQSSLS